MLGEDDVSFVLNVFERRRFGNGWYMCIGIVLGYSYLHRWDWIMRFLDDMMI